MSGPDGTADARTTDSCDETGHILTAARSPSGTTIIYTWDPMAQTASTPSYVVAFDDLNTNRSECLVGSGRDGTMDTNVTFATTPKVGSPSLKTCLRPPGTAFPGSMWATTCAE